MPDAPRRYYVHDCARERGSGRVAAADDFHEAAIAFAEECPHAEAGELRLIVRDCETGREQCFVVDLAQHAAEPC